MKRLYSMVVYCFFIIIFINAKNDVGAIFKMPQPIDKQHSILREYHTNSEIILDNKKCISGLSVSGKTILHSDTSLVRILLVDITNSNYLIFEDFYLTHEMDSFQNIALETAELDSITPYKIKIIIRDAFLQIDTINYSFWNSQTRQNQHTQHQSNTQRIESIEEYFVDKWNEYNATHNNYWIAGKTSLSNFTYSQKKEFFGAVEDDFITDGLEYYIGGFFIVHSNRKESDIQSQQNSPRVANSNYIESFDWRNRHGKNWMTSVKNQTMPQNSTGNGGCWAFGTCAAVESAINLQFNRLLNYDLAEQELGSCTNGSLHTGGAPFTALRYMKNNGIVTEECMPFENADTVPCSKKCNNPNDIIYITNYQYINPTEENLKNALIHNGPIASGLNNNYINHEMCLCGYGIVKEGDSIELVPYTNQGTIKIKIEAGNELIGQTYWIYKNSYGLSNNFNGYLYAVYENASTRAYTYSITYPIISEVYSQNDVIIEDADGDGYFFWGLGQRPLNCPICCPLIPDGDDADAEKAEMNAYGYFISYKFPYDTIYVTHNTDWTTDDTICGNIVVTNNSILSVSSSIILNPAAKIYIKSGSSLVVDGGTIINSDLIVEDKGYLILRNHGVLKQTKKDCTEVKKGGELLVENGEILIFE